MNLYFWVFVGGGFGSMARYAISKLMSSYFHTINPIGTLLSNIASTSLLGILLLVVSAKTGLSANMKAMLVVGFCGGFSTFSTFSMETFMFLRHGSYLLAAANIIISLLLGLLVLYLISKIV